MLRHWWCVQWAGIDVPVRCLAAEEVHIAPAREARAQAFRHLGRNGMVGVSILQMVGAAWVQAGPRGLRVSQQALTVGVSL